METMESFKTKHYNSAVWFQLEDIKYQRISLPFLRAIFSFFLAYFDWKFVGGAHANRYGKLAPVVEQCFECQKH